MKNWTSRTKHVCAAGLLAFAFVVPARAALVETYSFTGLNRAVPNGNASGISDVRTLSSQITEIDSVSVTLQVVGGFNGDLYCYLRHGSGFSVLLNRPGRTAGNSFGYDDSGFNVTFSDGAMNGDIHSYRAVVTPTPGNPLTGTWQPDARNVDPANVVDTTARTALLSSFHSGNASGDWTLFMADLQDGGGTSVLDSWGLQITAVPEPITAGLMVFAAAAICLRGLQRLWTISLGSPRRTTTQR